MELRGYLRLLSTGWVLIATPILVTVAAASAFSLLQTPSYSATAKVLVSAQSAGSASDLEQGDDLTVARGKTYAEVATLPLILAPVIDSLGLDFTPEELADHIAASSPRESAIITITATVDNPVLAAEIANEVSQSLVDNVQQLESSDDSAAVATVKLTPIQVATVPLEPVSPSVLHTIALAALIGLGLGVVLAVLREALDTRIRTLRDVAQISDLPVLGSIVFDPNASNRPLIVHADLRNQRSESFRTLRTNLHFLDAGRAERSFVVTSSIGGEGKSTTSANLCIALADAGARVLLVDADLRRPKIAEYMDIEGAAGLTDVLIGRAELSDVIQPWGKGQLFVLPAGRIPPNPSELLGSSGMKHLIDELNRAFEVVIFDSPPLLPVTDAAILAKSVGGAIVIVAAGHTRKKQLAGAIHALQSVEAPISGLVVTMLPTGGPDSYGYSQAYGVEPEGALEPAPGPRRAGARS